MGAQFFFFKFGGRNSGLSPTQFSIPLIVKFQKKKKKVRHYHNTHYFIKDMLS